LRNRWSPEGVETIELLTVSSDGLVPPENIGENFLVDVKSVVSRLIEDYYNLMYDEWKIVEPKSQKSFDPKCDLAISPMDFFQTPNGVIIRKETKNQSVTDYRNLSYKALCKYIWRELVDNILYTINNSIDTGAIDDILTWISGKEMNQDSIQTMKETIMALSVIESEIVWKGDIFRNYTLYLLLNCKCYTTLKILALFMNERWYYDMAFKFVSELKDSKILLKDKELLQLYIELNIRFNWGEKLNGKIINAYWMLIGKLEVPIEENDILLYKKDYKLLYEATLISYLKDWGDPKDIIKVANCSRNLWSKISDFYLVYWYILKWDLEIAKSFYQRWKWQINLEINFLEDFYIYSAKLNIPWSIELLMTYYRNEFKTKWYNEDLFNRLINVARIINYNFTENDKIFFYEFEKYYLEKENEDDIFELIWELFMKYTETKFHLYLDKILLICSKCLRSRYENSQDVKATLTYWFENLFILDKYIWQEVSNELLSEELSKISELLEDDDYVNKRFNELLTVFSIHILNVIQSDWNDWTISTSLASIFEYYWMHEYVNEAINVRWFFEEFPAQEMKEIITLH